MTSFGSLTRVQERPCTKMNAIPSIILGRPRSWQRIGAAVMKCGSKRGGNENSTQTRREKVGQSCREVHTTLTQVRHFLKSLILFILLTLYIAARDAPLTASLRSLHVKMQRT